VKDQRKIENEWEEALGQDMARLLAVAIRGRIVGPAEVYAEDLKEARCLCKEGYQNGDFIISLKKNMQ